MNYTQAEINALFLQFHSIPKYQDKLKFYDNHFNILPFTLPDFETNLFAFFSEEHLQQFESLLQLERRSNGAMTKIFIFGTDKYTFSIKPLNSNYSTFNNYIICRFLQAGAQLKPKIQQELALIRESNAPIRTLLASANEMLAILKKKIASDNRRKFTTQFTLVFLKGFTDYMSSSLPAISSKRKKIIELYLYSQGFMYGEYVQFLNKSTFPQITGKEHTDALNLEKKISLLKELGFIEAIKKKYPFLNKTDLDKKIEETIYLITGERMAGEQNRFHLF